MDEVWFLHPILLPSDHAHGLHVARTCAALAAAGARVRLLAKRNPLRPARDAAEALAALGVAAHPGLRIDWLPTRHKGMAGLVARGRVRRAPGDPVFYATHLRLAAAALRRRAHPPRGGGRGLVIAELHGPVPAPGSGWRERRTAARVLRDADGIVCTTAPLAERVRAESAAISIIPLAVELAAFPPARGEGPPRLIYFGHLYPLKGVDLVVRALAKLPGLGALVIGGRDGADEDLARLRGLAAELGVAARVEFAGLVPQRAIAARLRASDIAVLPTRSLGGQELAGSLKLFEYGACGLPIVATDMPALRAMTRNGDAALLFADADPAHLASRVEELLAHPAQRAALAQRGRELALAHSWEARARAILAFAAELRARRGASR